MVWILTIYMGITWAGPGSVYRAEFPSADACYRALAAVRTNDSPVAESGQKKSMVAVCGPKPTEKP